jgi:hypothetical protein
MKPASELIVAPNSRSATENAPFGAFTASFAIVKAAVPSLSLPRTRFVSLSSAMPVNSTLPDGAAE